MNNQKTYTAIKKDPDNNRLILSTNHTKPKLLDEIRINHSGCLNNILQLHAGYRSLINKSVQYTKYCIGFSFKKRKNHQAEERT